MISIPLQKYLNGLCIDRKTGKKERIGRLYGKNYRN